MSLRTPNLSVEIAVANMDLYPMDLPGRASWGSNLEQLVPYLEQTGCRNFEIHPTKRIMRDIEARIQRKDTEIINVVVGSVHQTFNNGGDFIGRVSDLRGVQRSQESVDSMTTIAEASTHPIPAVYYLGTGIIPPNPAILSVVQPSSEVYGDLGVRSNIGLRRALARFGILGLCPDTVHSRRRALDGTRPPAIEDVWADQFASGHVYEMHDGADRVDMAVRDPELAAISEHEFKAFTSNRWQDGRDTKMGEMIVAGIENWVPPTELAHAVGGPVLRHVLELAPRPGAILGRIKEHARFVENLAELVRETGATPLLWQDAHVA